MFIWSKYFVSWIVQWPIKAHRCKWEVHLVHSILYWRYHVLLYSSWAHFISVRPESEYRLINQTMENRFYSRSHWARKWSFIFLKYGHPPIFLNGFLVRVNIRDLPSNLIWVFAKHLTGETKKEEKEYWYNETLWIVCYLLRHWIKSIDLLFVLI